jgi:hypothetical protein
MQNPLQGSILPIARLLSWYRGHVGRSQGVVSSSEDGHLTATLQLVEPPRRPAYGFAATFQTSFKKPNNLETQTIIVKTCLFSTRLEEARRKKE